MAKSASSGDGKVNRSQAVRDFLAENPGADSQAIIAGLGGKGIKVTPTMVYYVRSKLRHAKRKDKRDRAAAASRLTTARDPVELVSRVKDLAREVGGLKNLKQLVDLLAE